ncbi:endonuclease [Sporosarcina sp. P16a]|uniref:endonuclease n=1 Tax=unclassified Sporosarcina TaxID=2647733 RepID=UPI000C16C9BA|nr:MULTISPECIES: endonuclease [unclassified Sporosarcina]PIC65913.1 endonuclease [Sporosarcina sp. P16a]PIC91980.1 endonuclease [Sporosarcina sp. P25]
MDQQFNFHARICGKLLGDGCLIKQGNRQPRFQFMHRIEDVSWAQYCYERLQDFLPLSPPTYSKVADPRLSKRYSERYIVQSRTHPTITNLYATWYPEGEKVIPLEFLDSYLNEEALSWWYQDDGHLKIVNGTMKKIILSADSFTTFENNYLIQLLFKKFKLRFSLDGQNRLILYDQFQIIYFLKMISPWLSPAMTRKAAVVLPLKPIAKRTTVYLPSTINLRKPTAEINERLVKLYSLLCEEKKSVCLNTTFKEFEQLTLVDDVPTIGYQIVIQEPYCDLLARVRQQTGLSVSLLVEYCFLK